MLFVCTCVLNTLNISRLTTGYGPSGGLKKLLATPPNPETQAA